MSKKVTITGLPAILTVALVFIWSILWLIVGAIFAVITYICNYILYQCMLWVGRFVTKLFK